MPAAQSAAQQQLTAAQQNAMARSLILQNSVPRIQQIASGTFNAVNNPQLNVQPRNVGLIRGFLVTLSAQLTSSVAGATLTKFGPANLASQITLTDLQNNTRIQTAGWHLHSVNTARAMRPFGFSPFTPSATALPIAYGNNYGEISALQTLADTNPHTVTMRYYVPCAYAQDDLRGAIYAAVTNATMNLQITMNQSPFVAAGDSTLAVYSGQAGTIGNVTYAVYQIYEDQLPMGNQGPILPIQDLSTIYELKNTSVNGLTVGNDFPIAYSNFRSYLSTFALFDNGGQLNPGTDVNYWALQSANFTNIWKMDPTEASLLSMLQQGVDYPSGLYYFSHRNRPINTSQFGNMELVVNPAVVNAGAQVLVGYEDFAIMSVLNQAGSLPGG